MKKKKMLQILQYVETNCSRTPIPKLRVLVSQGLLFSNFIFCDCSLMYKEGFCKLFWKILFFKAPVIKRKFFAAQRRTRGWNCWFFGIDLLKIYIPDRQKCVRFEIQKNAKSLHPTAQCTHSISTHCTLVQQCGGSGSKNL